MIKPKNTKRADRIWTCMRAFYPAARDGQPDIRPAVIDLMIDVHHLCDKLGIDFSQVENVAYAHYIDER